MVKDLANRSACWRWYDEQFRYLRQTKPDSYHWEQVQWDLWFQAHLIQDYVNSSPIQDYDHPDDHASSTYEMTPGFKPFTMAS